MIDFILLGGFVITMDGKRRVIPNGEVAVDKGAVVQVGEAKEITSKMKAKEIIDCSNHVIMPGFVDAHGHAGHTAFKFIIKDTGHWMPAITHTYKHYTSDEFWYIEGRNSALERLKGGITTGVCVMSSMPRCDDPIMAINNAKAYAEIGIRGIVCAGPCSLPWPHNYSRWVNGKREMRAVTFEQVIASLETVIKTLNNTNNGKTFAYATPYGIITSAISSDDAKLTEHDKRQAKEILRIAKEYNTRIHSDCFCGGVKLAMQDPENAILGPNVHLQHCSNLLDEEVKILADTGTNASVTYYSEAPVHRMLDMGVSLAASSDGPKALPSSDMFANMRLFQSNYRNRANDQNLLPYGKMLELVTIDAAKVVGLDHMVGSLEAGKRADIITINLLNPRLSPNFNTVQSLLISGQSCDVDNVMVDGKFLMRDGKVLNVDEKKIILEAQKETEKTVERARLHGFAYLDNLYWGHARKPDTPEIFDIEWQRQDGGHY